MLSKLLSAAKKKKPEVEQLEANLTDRCEFIPYHSHYNPHTIVTKNGELMQIIKIDGNLLGSPCENLDGIHASLCTTIRQVLIQSGASEQFAFWLHTVRKRSPMSYDSSVKAGDSSDASVSNDFSTYLNDKWEKQHHWNSYYQNDVYLTILHEGQAAPFFDSKNIKSLVFPKLNRSFRNQYLDSMYPLLDETCSFIIESINSQYKARKLTLVERVPEDAAVAGQPIFYSELMEFLGLLINLRQEDFPLPDLDLSVALQTTQLAFGSNAIEALNETTGKRRFSAILSLKQYIDMPVDAVDCVLQAPLEIIISQSFSFIPAEKALKHYKAQRGLFNGSGDIKANDAFSVNRMFNCDRKKPVDFGDSHTSITVLADDLRNLDGEVGKFLNAFAKLGLIVGREDIKMEEGFWAQLPGNFEFIRRKAPLATEQIGAFCRLNRFHTGAVSNNHWGSRLALIPTSVDSPYFFNFHASDNGHTVLFDFNSFDDRIGKVLEYFLLTKTRKFNARIFIFDKDQSARLLLNKLGGTYFSMTQLRKVSSDEFVDKSPRLALNPFALEASNYNHSFLAAWCGLLISPNAPLDDTTRSVLREAVTKLYELPPAERNLPNMVGLVAQSDSNLAKPLENWIGEAEYAGLFDFAQDSLDISLDIAGFDMTTAIAKPAFLLPLFSYLMHRVVDSIDGRPTVIVMNEAWGLLENHFFAPRLESLLDMLRQKNVMVIFTTSNPSICKETVTLSALMAGTSTQIYIPDEMSMEYQSQGIGLNNHDASSLLDMNRQKGDFLLKQNSESVALCVSLETMEDVVAIFTNDLKAIVSARGRFAGMPKDY